MNLNHRLGAALFFALALVEGARAQDEWSATSESFICRSTTEVREVKTYVSGRSAGGAGEHPGCRVDYIKNGKTHTIWSSASSSAYCHGKAASVAAKLSTHFTCKPLHVDRSE